MYIPTLVIGILFVVVVLATLVLILTRQHPYIPGEITRLREIVMTAVMGVLLWGIAGLVLYYAFTSPGPLMSSNNAKINTHIFLLLSIFLGSYTLLYSFVKTIIVGSENITYVNIIGQSTSLNWEDVIETQVVAGKRLKISSKDNSITVGGNRSQMKDFVRLVKKFLPVGVSVDLYFK